MTAIEEVQKIAGGNFEYLRALTIVSFECEEESDRLIVIDVIYELLSESSVSLSLYADFQSEIWKELSSFEVNDITDLESLIVRYSLEDVRKLSKSRVNEAIIEGGCYMVIYEKGNVVAELFTNRGNFVYGFYPDVFIKTYLKNIKK